MLHILQRWRRLLLPVWQGNKKFGTDWRHYFFVAPQKNYSIYIFLKIMWVISSSFWGRKHAEKVLTHPNFPFEKDKKLARATTTLKTKTERGRETQSCEKEILFLPPPLLEGEEKQTWPRWWPHFLASFLLQHIFLKKCGKTVAVVVAVFVRRRLASSAFFKAKICLLVR